MSGSHTRLEKFPPPPENSSPTPEVSSSPLEKSSPPPEKSSPPSSPPPSPPSSSPSPCHSFFPSAAKEVEFGTVITTADESIVSSAGEAIDREAEVKEDTPTPTGEEKGKRRADIDAVAKFEEREAKKRMVLSSGKC